MSCKSQLKKLNTTQMCLECFWNFEAQYL